MKRVTVSGEICFAFRLEDAPAALGLRTATQVEQTLRLMRDAGDLVLAPSEQNDRFTTPLTIKGQRERYVVIRGRGDRLGVERLGRGRRWDERQRFGSRPEGRVIPG